MVSLCESDALIKRGECVGNEQPWIISRVINWVNVFAERNTYESLNILTQTKSSPNPYQLDMTFYERCFVKEVLVLHTLLPLYIALTKCVFTLNKLITYLLCAFYLFMIL